MKATTFQKKLLRWFDVAGRKHLPWQIGKTAYRVWVSEIMLQQTQVATVIPYFERFLLKFPNIESLAEGKLDDVLFLWAGLGYYSRARNLHKAARFIMDEFGGRFPNTVEEICRLPGIGASTAGAVISLAFDQRAVILDGNVKRVLSRLHGIKEPISEKAIEKKLWDLASYYTPHKRVADYTQAMMDFGATFCLRSQPQCQICPFKKACVAYNQNLTTSIPAKTAKKKLPIKKAHFIAVKYQENILLYKRNAEGIWGGLWCLPEIKIDSKQSEIDKVCQDNFNLKVLGTKELFSFRHTFTHFHLVIHSTLVEVTASSNKVIDEERFIWYNLHQPPMVGLPKPMQTIISGLI